ncbi:MAG: FG-GAP-like repeat-containing protein [Candidatus Nanoarchaeia archaeon]
MEKRGVLIFLFFFYILLFLNQSSSFDALRDVVLNGSYSGGRFGSSLASGDVNGDGFGDVLIGAPEFADKGAMYVFFGTADGIFNYFSEDANLTFNSVISYSNLGYSIAGGDVNGDGFDDIIVGAYDSEQVFVFFGENYTDIINVTTAIANVTIKSNEDSDYFGNQVTGGDVNGDGFDDIIVGAYRANKVYVFFGDNFTTPLSVNASEYANVTFNSSNDNKEFGWDICSCDFNNDGYSDIIVGDDTVNASDKKDAGIVYVFLSDNYTDRISIESSYYANLTFNGTYANGYFGSSVSCADFNNDSYSDVVGGAYYVYTASGSSRGQVLVFFGDNYTDYVNVEGPSYANITINDTSGDQYQLGYKKTLSFCDVNRDGYQDILASAYTTKVTFSSAGRIYAFFGDNFTTALYYNTTESNLSLNGTHLQNTLGYGLTCSDFNNDGYGEVVGGSMYDNAAYVYFFDEIPPEVNLDWPGDNYLISGLNVVFGFTAFDAHPTTCNLFYSTNDTDWALRSSVSYASNNQTNFTSLNLADGNYTWNVRCNDGASESAFNSTNFTVSVDATGPTVTTTSPENYGNLSYGTVTFTYQVSENNSVAGCYLYFNSTLNSTDLSVDKEIDQTFVVVLPDANYQWYIMCNDSVSNQGNTSTMYFTVDSTEPNVTLQSPVNYGNFTNGAVNFTYRVYDNGSISYCDLYINGVLNSTDDSVDKGVDQYFEVELADGVYEWNVGCNDSSSNYANSSVWRFTIDLAPPVVSLTTPVDYENLTNGNVTFTYNVSDSNIISSCSLYINDTLNLTDDSVDKDTDQNFIVDLSDGDYEWFVSCNDSLGNEGNSSTWYFNIASSQFFTPTIIEPSDTTIHVRGSISYVCEVSSDTGIVKWLWTLTKPDLSTVSKTGGSLSEDTVTFSGDDVNIAGAYSVVCEVEYSTTSKKSDSKTFSVFFSTTSSGGGGGESITGDVIAEPELTQKEVEEESVDVGQAEHSQDHSIEETPAEQPSPAEEKPADTIIGFIKSVINRLLSMLKSIFGLF